MNVLEDVCLLSCEQWVESFPQEIPAHQFSKQHQEKMKEIFNPENTAKHKFSKKTIKILLIAAVLLALTITATAVPTNREFIVSKFSNHSDYNVADTDNAKEVKSLEVNYIPEGFEKAEDEDYEYLYVYRNGDKEFAVVKCMITSSISYDTEKYDDETIELNGIKAVYYKSGNNHKGIIFNNGEYIYVVSGNIDKETLVKIAQNVE